MAKLIKQKFLQGVDSTKFEIAQSGALMARDSNGDLVEILKLSPSDQVLLLGQPVATSAELNAVIAQITQEILDRQADVNAEESRAMAAEAQIASDLAQEVSDRQADVNAEESRAMAAEAQIASDLAAEVSRATAAEGVIASDLASEVSRATAAEGVLSSAISAEESRAMAAESVLDGRLDAVEAELPLKAAITYVDSQDAATLQSGKDYTDQKITDLVNGAPAVLDTLKELADALGNDQNFAVSIANQIAGIESDIAAEVARAEAAEGQIASDLAAEVVRATAAEGQIASDLAAEVVRATAAEGQVASDLASEVVRATAAEGQIASDLAAEVSRAQAAEAQISSDLAAEVSRASAEEQTFLKLDGTRFMTGNLRLEALGSDSLVELNRTNGFLGIKPPSITADAQLFIQPANANSYYDNTGKGTTMEFINHAYDQLTDLNISAKQVVLGSEDGVKFSSVDFSNTYSFTDYGSIVKDGSDMKVQAVAGLKLSSASDIKMLVPVSMESHQIKNLAAPSYPTDAATKGYVDDVANSVSISLDAEVARAQAAEAQIASDLAAEVSRAQGEEARIEGKLDAITWKPHYVATVGAQVITDQYIDLPDLIVPGSLFLSTDLVVWYEGVHYTTSTVAGKTRVNFIGDMATGGQCALESDDDLYAKYQYLA